MQRLTREQVRSVDRIAIDEYGMSGVVLMENAGRGCAELILNRTRVEPNLEPACGPVVICCGRGNNGGDGYVMARHLDNAGIPVAVWLLSDPSDVAGDAAINLSILRQTSVAIHHSGDTVQLTTGLSTAFANAEWIVDAILGTGASGAPREPAATVIECINLAAAKVMAVDLPSGLDCNTGLAAGACIRADVTATFVAEKVVFSTTFARSVLGQIAVVDIGIPRSLLTRFT